MADTENKVEKTVTKKEKAEKPAKKKDKPGMFARIGNFFRNLKSEFKKITWSPKNQVFKNTLVVVVVTVVSAVAVCLVHEAFWNGIIALGQVL
ncbi:MAG: preprotein translocase subunit SecE [Clostridia bacterium]|nr:preprotein translocase subunit SecE [Clostridia bacterium]